MLNDRRYEVFARRKKPGGRVGRLTHEGTFGRRGWQFAVKFAARLREKGRVDVVLRELTVTREVRSRGG